jgi:hypothetical protein
MDRDFDRLDPLERTSQERTMDKLRSNPVRPREQVRSRDDEPRSAYAIRDRSYRLNISQARMLSEVGTFRTIHKSHLLKSIYGNREELFNRDLTHLHRQNLVRIVGPKGSPDKYIVLTKPARELTQKHLRANPQQEIYSGAVKLREIKHDAALYQVYAKAAGEIEERGGKTVRVVLDYEFKRRMNRELVRIRQLPKEHQQKQLEELATRENLKVIEGKIPLPDIRLEYEMADGERSHCDLELTTEHYRGQTIAQKKAAGFHLYGSNHRGRAAYGPDLMGGILSL